MKWKNPKRTLLAGIALGTALLVSACSGAGGSASNGSAANTTRPTGSFTLKVAYGSDYVFDTGDLATKWWQQVADDYKKKYPKATIEWVPIPGSYNDIVNKLSLMYKSPSTAPDVAEIPSGGIGLWATSNYLLPLNGYLGSTDWWSKIPPVVQSEGTFSGKTYAVNHGENDTALLYNKDMFKKAGIPVPWVPKTWNDILDAAQKISSALPGVTPLWLNAGVNSGANGLLQGINNFIVGTKSPTIQDNSNNKFVVDSPGIRDALTFYKKAFSSGVTPPVSQLFSPNAVTTPLTQFRDGKLAIAVGSNYYGGNWTDFINAPAWPEASTVIGEAILPTNYDPTKAASTLGGWDLAVSAKAKQPQAAFDFVNVAMSEKNLIDAANWAGWVPPVKDYWTSPRYTDFAPPYNEFFAKILPSATLTPTSSDYSVWVQGMGQATGTIAQDPSTTVDQAVAILKNYVSQQLGPDRVETK